VHVRKRTRCVPSLAKCVASWRLNGIGSCMKGPPCLGRSQVVVFWPGDDRASIHPLSLYTEVLEAAAGSYQVSIGSRA
jgi:hypothetical protein